ncbi:protein FAM118A-like [Lissotriton helveticus]
MNIGEFQNFGQAFHEWIEEACALHDSSSFSDALLSFPRGCVHETSQQKRCSTPERDSSKRCRNRHVSTDQSTDCRNILRSLTIKNPQDIVLVVGTGVSSAAAPDIEALNSFRCFLLAVLDAAEELQVVHPSTILSFRTKVKKERDLFVVAHDLIREMSPLSGEPGPTFYRDCLLRIFDNLEQCVTNPTVLESILILIEKGAMVITTNYDTFLETCGYRLGRHMESLDMQDIPKVLHWSKGHRRYGILHLHGKYSDPSGILWDTNEYKELLHNPDLVDALHTLYYKKSFVFLGCGESLRDQIFQALFWHSVEKSHESEHYMLVLKKDDDYFFKLQKDMLLLGIKVISYGDSCMQFPQYLKSVFSLISEERRSDATGGSNALGVCRPECAKRKITKKCECEPLKKQRQSEEGAESKRKITKDPSKKCSQGDDALSPPATPTYCTSQTYHQEVTPHPRTGERQWSFHLIQCQSDGIC